MYHFYPYLRQEGGGRGKGSCGIKVLSVPVFYFVHSQLTY